MGAGRRDPGGVVAGDRRGAVRLALLRRADGLRQPRHADPAGRGRRLDLAGPAGDDGDRAAAARAGAAGQGARDRRPAQRRPAERRVRGRRPRGGLPRGRRRPRHPDHGRHGRAGRGHAPGVGRREGHRGARPVGPPPVQPGGPELLVGTMGPKTIRHAAAWADGLAGFTLDLDPAAGGGAVRPGPRRRGPTPAGRRRGSPRRSGSRSTTATGAPASRCTATCATT